MIRVLVLGALLLLLQFLRTITLPGTDRPGVEPMTLAAVGFVVLAAFTVGELGGRAKLPRITGYILSGVVLGPHLANWITPGVVEDMTVFNNLALGLIALTAGLELDLPAIGRVLRTLVATLAAKLPLLLLLVGGTLYGLETTFGLLGLPTEGARRAVALILAVLGIGTSPAIVLAVSNETRARGRLTDLALAMAVVKDLVVVVSLAVAIAVARTLIDPAAALGLDALGHVALEMGGSLLAGALIGGLLVLYVTYVHQEMLLAVLVVVLVGAEIAQLLHLELLLMLIAAGVVVKNLSKHGEAVHHPLERVALPVFVVFFTTVGAQVDLLASLALLPLALALVLARLIAFFLSARFGAWVGREGKAVTSKAWLTYWPQAGITLGLVALAAEALPDIGPVIEEVGFAVVALNLLAGPIATGLGLRGAGETPEARKPKRERGSRDLAPPRPLDRPAIEPILPLPPEVPDPRVTFPAKLETEPLTSTALALATDLEDILDAFLERRVAPLAEEAEKLAARMLGEAADATGVVSHVSKTLSEREKPLTDDWETLTEDLRRELSLRLLELPMRLTVPLSEGLLVPRPQDAPWTRFARWRLRLLRAVSPSAARTRTVHLQVIARHRLEPRIAAAVRALTSSTFEHYARVFDEVRAVVASLHSPAEAREGVRVLGARWLEATRRDARAPLRRGLVELADLAAEAGAPGAAAAGLRLSKVRARLVADIEALRRDTRRWLRVARAGIDTLRAEALVREAEERLSAATRQRVDEPLGILGDRIVPAVEQVAKRLDALRETVAAGGEQALELAAVVSKTANVLPRAEQKRILRPRNRFRKLTQHSKLPSDLARLEPRLPARLDLLPTGALVDAHEHPERVTVGQVQFAERMRSVFATFVGQVREAMLRAENLVAFFDGRLADAVHLATYGVEAARAYEAAPEARRATAERALARARDALLELAEEMRAARAAAEAATRAADERAREALHRLVREPRPRAVARVQGTLQAQRAAIRTATTRAARGARDLAHHASRRVRGWLRREAPAPALRDAGGLRRVLETSAPAPSRLGLPGIYTKVFDLGPLEDARLAVARAAALARVADLLHPPGGRRVLIEGAPGSGRTSFLNMLELRARTRRVVRIDATFHPRTEGLVGALAAELACPDYPLAVTQALLSEPTLVVVDDLGHHVLPSPAGLEELEATLRIIVDTARHVSWAVSIESSELAALGELIPIFGVFTDREVLGPVGGEELEAVVAARMNLAGHEVRFRRSSWRQLLGRRPARARRRRRAYFEALARAAEGNLREALVLHLRSLGATEDGALFASRPSAEPPPRLEGLGPRALACLAVVAKFGPLREEEVAEILLVSRDRVRQHTLALAHGGLLEPDDRRLLRIPAHVRIPVGTALTRLGVLEEAPIP
jgi:Kef-type K+ transport system membrane component KefB